MSNRVEQAIARMQGKIAALDEEKVLKLEENCKINFQEHFAYQQAQAQAHAGGKLSTGEAQILYQSLGEVWFEGNGGWKKGTPLATKVVVTQVVGELMGVSA